MALSQVDGIQMKVCVPEPRFSCRVPPFTKAKVVHDDYKGLSLIRHPYSYIPKYMKHLDGKFYFRGLRSYIEEYTRVEHPDILDAHFAWPDGVGVYHLARKLNIPYSITLRGWIWVGMKQPKLWKQAVEAIKNATVVINLCEPMLNVCKDIGCDEKRLFIVHNGIDKDRFFPIERTEARAQLGLPPDIPIVVCVSFIQERKGIIELIQAIEGLPKDALLVLVGAPSEPKYYKKVLNLIKSLGLSNRVILTGTQPHDKVPLFLNAGDVTTLPSYWEGSPNAVVESLGCGTPVVATPVGSVPEQIIPGKNGYIVPMKDPDSLSRALNQTLLQEWDRDEICASVKSWDQVAKNLNKIFTSSITN